MHTCIGNVPGQYAGNAETVKVMDGNTYDDPAQLTSGNDYELTEMPKPTGTLTSTTSDYDDIADTQPSSGLVIKNPSLVESQHYELPQRRNIYSTMSDAPLLRASSYENPVGTHRVRMSDLTATVIPCSSLCIL